MKYLLFFVIILFNTNISFSQSWNELNKKVQESFGKRDWKSFFDFSKQAKLQAEKEFGKLDSAYAVSCVGLGLGYGIFGDYENSEKYFLEGLKVRRKLFAADGPEVNEALNNLATLYYHSGQFLKAEKYFKDGLDFNKINAADTLSERTSDALVWLGNLYSAMGRIQESKILFEKVHENGKKIYKKEDFRYALSLVNVAKAYYDEVRIELADSLFKNAISIFELKPDENLNSHATVSKGLGKIYTDIGRYNEALPLYKKSLALYEKLFGVSHPYYADCLLQLTKLYQAMGSEKEPIDSLYRQVISINEKTLNSKHPGLVKTKSALANYHYFKGEKNRAIKLLIENLDYFEKYLKENFNYLAENEREAFYTTVKENFEQFAAIAVAEHKNKPELLSTLYNLQIRYKSILLNTSNQIKRRILESGNQNLIGLFDEVQELKKLLGNPKDNILNFRGLRRDSLGLLLQEKDEQLTQLSIFYAKENELPSWEKIQSKLKRKEVAVEVIRFRAFDYQKQLFTNKVKYAALIVTPKTKNNPEIVVFENGNYLEKEAIAYFRKCIRYEIEDDFSYDLFWKPLQEKLKKFDTIYISLDGIFHSINLKSLRNPNSKQYLLNEKEIVVVTNGKDILNQKIEKLPIKSGLLIGSPDFGTKPKKVDKNRGGSLISFERSIALSPLPGTEKEVTSINELLISKGWSTKSFINEKAQESVLKKMEKPNILHIATHGFFQKNASGDIKYNNNPLYRSGLLLSGAEKTLDAKEDIRGNAFFDKEDGILTAFETMFLNLNNTNLVVLSACETGLGEVVNGEGVYGLQRALKVAGARSIIMSLWKVDDEATGELMVNFYQNWLSGKTKREAFKIAQNVLVEKYNHPYYWGGFVLIGE